MIFKTLWAHHKQNGFVFAEIILITVLSFYFIDHFVVTTYDIYFCRPAGDFEREHLLVGQVMQVYPDAASATEKELDSLQILQEAQQNMASLYALRDQVRALPEVQYAGLANDFIGCHGDIYNYVSTYSSEADSTRRCGACQRRFLLHEQYFETQGLMPIEGSPAAAVLSEECPEDGAVISRSLAQELFGTDQVVGRRIVEWDFSDRALREEGGYKIVNRYTIAGVMEDFRIGSVERHAYSILIPVPNVWSITPEMLIRLRPEVDAEAFVNRLKDAKFANLRNGGLALGSLHIYPDYLKQFSMNDHTIINTLLGILLTLFLLNVVLGTLGTYWLQLRKRTEEFGIMRSFGAKRQNIFGIVWKEVALLTLVACIIGQIIWLQFAINIGLSEGLGRAYAKQETSWVAQFWPHFLIICVIQYLLMLSIVTLGILIPSLIAMYKKPVDALRYE